MHTWSHRDSFVCLTLFNSDFKCIISLDLSDIVVIDSLFVPSTVANLTL